MHDGVLIGAGYAASAHVSRIGPIPRIVYRMRRDVDRRCGERYKEQRNGCPNNDPSHETQLLCA